jgi:hypothetical protein
VAFPLFEGCKGHERFENIDGTLVYHTAGLLTISLAYPSSHRLMQIATWRNRVTRLAMRPVGKDPLYYFSPLR